MAPPESRHSWITPRLPVLATLAPVAWCHRCGALRADAADLVTRAVLAGFAAAARTSAANRDAVRAPFRYLAPRPMAELGAWSAHEPACR